MSPQALEMGNDWFCSQVRVASELHKRLLISRKLERLYRSAAESALVLQLAPVKADCHSLATLLTVVSWSSMTPAARVRDIFPTK